MRLCSEQGPGSSTFKINSLDSCRFDKRLSLLFIPGKLALCPAGTIKSDPFITLLEVEKKLGENEIIVDM